MIHDNVYYESECFHCEESNQKRFFPSWYVTILFDPVPVTSERILFKKQNFEIILL